jgi:diaminopropionate ammonia-lyase
MTDPDYADLRKEIGLTADSRVLLFSTEGDTDPDRYKNIVWKGLPK